MSVGLSENGTLADPSAPGPLVCGMPKRSAGMSLDTCLAALGRRDKENLP